MLFIYNFTNWILSDQQIIIYSYILLYELLKKILKLKIKMHNKIISSNMNKLYKYIITVKI